jgi:hypothetical protein
VERAELGHDAPRGEREPPVALHHPVLRVRLGIARLTELRGLVDTPQSRFAALETLLIVS